MTKTTLQRQAEARAIIAQPKPEHSVTLRMLAWSILKASRGQTIRQRRLQAQAARQVV